MKRKKRCPVISKFMFVYFSSSSIAKIRLKYTVLHEKATNLGIAEDQR